MPATLGTQTPEAIFAKGPESHKLHIDFEVRASNEVYLGQMVAIHTDGTVFALAADSDEHACVGVAVHNASAGEQVTVATRGYAVVRGQSQAALSPGPVQAKSFDSTNKVNEFATSTGVGKTIGWSLDEATAANQTIRVLIKN